MLSSHCKSSNLFAIIGQKFINYKKDFILSQKNINCNNVPSNVLAEGILCCAISLSGQYFAVCDDLKQLLVFNNDNKAWNITRKYNLSRKACCLTFTADDLAVLVGEKSGCVHRYELSKEQAIDEAVNDEDELLGHLSLLSSVIASDDGRLIGTCDRDSKIRISRTSQPFVIVSFCLGHKKSISQISFLDNSHLISASGDKTVRLWNAMSGKELDIFDLDQHLHELHETKTKDIEKSFLVSRLIVVGNAVLLAIPKYNCILALKMSMHADIPCFDATSSRVFCPESKSLLDFCVIDFKKDAGTCTVVCLTDPISKLISWDLEISSDDQVIKWGKMCEWNEFPSEVLSSVDKHLRLQLLDGLSKIQIDKDGAKAYEEGKEDRHKRSKERHQRHQAKRRKMKQSVADD